MHTPIWSQRMPRLFRNIILIDAVEASAFYLADRSCFLNPWTLQRHAAKSASAVILAGFLVHSLCGALLLTNTRRRQDTRSRQYLMLKASIRFLNKCLESTTDTDIEAARNAFQSYL